MNKFSYDSSYSIPIYRQKEVLKLYNAIKNDLGDNLFNRKKKFIEILKIYYKWESYSNLKVIFNKYVMDKDINYINNLNSNNLKKIYGNDIIKLFGFIDTNNNGSIDLYEFKTILRKINIYNSNIEELFQTADLNNDGVLDIDEFFKFITRNDILYEKFHLIIKKIKSYNNNILLNNKLKIFKKYDINIRPSLADIKNFNEFNLNDLI